MLLEPAFLQHNALSRLKGRATYQLAQAVVSGKPFYNLELSAWYDLDQKAHVALTTTYTRGKDEDTAGLSGKF